MGIRDITLLASRAVLGGYLAAHGAQKLFGTFGGHGIEPTAAAFDRLGLAPGRGAPPPAGGGPPRTRRAEAVRHLGGTRLRAESRRIRSARPAPGPGDRHRGGAGRTR